MTCTTANHQGAIKEPAASLFLACETHPVETSVARLGGFEFDCAGKYLGRVDKIWAGFWSVWRFSKHINCID